MNMLKLVASALLAMSVAGQALADEMELKFGHVGKPGSLFEISVNEFAARANVRLAGKATVISTVADEFGLFEMPYLVQNRSHMSRIEDQIFWEKIHPAAEAKGYKILALWENGFRHITNNVRAIDKPDDLQGIKLRTPKGSWRVKMFKSYGANPTPMSFSEVFTALKTGVIDGQENPFAQIYSGKFQEVQKYLSLTGHVYTPAYVIVGKEHWDSLPADVQEILVETAKETQSFVYAKAAELEVDLLQKLKDGGIAVNQADKAAFIAASKGIYDEFSTTVSGGDAMIAAALALAEGS
jgi:tripartite ATP-independent transporter DctP family solute receptor